MKKQIVRVSALQSAKVAAMLYLVTSLPILLFMFIAVMMGNGNDNGVMLATLIVAPVIYALFGFLFTLIGAWIYNQVASRVGGFEFTTAEVSAS